MKLLNIGCGKRLHKDWINIDTNPLLPGVERCNVLDGIPFTSETFDFVYHSHVLEHIAREKASAFIKECFRILKPKGIIRIIVPDLELIVNLYLKALKQSLEGDKQWQYNYEWLKLELYDQAVREKSGGDMKAFLLQNPIPNKNFVLDHVGIDCRQLIENNSTRSENINNGTCKNVFSKLYKFIRNFNREDILRLILAKEYELLQLGRFRRSGEIHLCMYDRYSLAKILTESGFQNPTQLTATESQLPNWTSYNLDTEPDGTVYKHDSLYMESTKQ